MEKEFIPYEERQLLNEIWELYDVGCFGYYSTPNNKPCGGNYPCYGENNAPTYSQVFRWFRENHKLRHSITGPSNDIEFYIYENTNDEPSFEDSCYWKSVEEVELVCLRELIEIVKERG